MKRVFVFEYLTGGGDAGMAEAGEALLQQGRAMRDAVVADLLEVPGVQVSAAVCEQAARLPPGAASAWARPGESAAAFVAREAAAHDLAWVIAPETGGLLAQLSRRVDPARWLGCDTAAIEVASSKRATLQRLAQAGIATPLAFGDEARRWVVKPDDGAGTVDTRVHGHVGAAEQDHARRLRAGQPSTLEPWVEGEALSLSLLCEPGRADLLSVNCQQVDVDVAGRVSFDGVRINALPGAESLVRIADAVARALPGLRGFVGIDLVWHRLRGPVVIEVNPRVTCAYEGLSAALDRSIAAEVLAAHVREPACA
ncbi:ATP-grasp domain-containing protein [Aquincola sp. MAHUQ-54]|uniref:ATP-grasp domain-containing protein n=1 Tax=Aquincola agrisoli TaxID=3119538 RepID=A0AAW9QB76_9BURK